MSLISGVPGLGRRAASATDKYGWGSATPARGGEVLRGSAVDLREQAVAYGNVIRDELERDGWRVLILRGSLDVVDDENVDGSSCRFQFEPKLLLQSLKERWFCIRRLGA